MAGDIRYDDPCGIARAMGVIGDRWAVLVVRELMFGPRRFAQLRAGLTGISPNVLSQRLRDLESSGVLCRVVLDESAAVTVYDLTERGRALEPVLIELGRWGSREHNTSKNDLSVGAMMFSYKTVFDPSRAADGIYGVRVDGESFTVTVHDGAIAVRRGLDEHSDVVLDTDMSTLRAVSFGREAVTSAQRAGRLRISGARRYATRFAAMFPVPAA
jgi:DNA-binding HxlR family transcriptional regulator